MDSEEFGTVAKDSLEEMWLNSSFNTSIFSEQSEYVGELQNIYTSKMLIDSSLAGIIPNIQNYKQLSPHIDRAIDGLETLKASFNKCVN